MAVRVGQSYAAHFDDVLTSDLRSVVRGIRRDRYLLTIGHPMVSIWRFTAIPKSNHYAKLSNERASGFATARKILIARDWL
jgi:hypothetical protein